MSDSKMNEETKRGMLGMLGFLGCVLIVFAAVVNYNNNNTKVKLAEIEVANLELTTNGGCTPSLDKQSIEPEDNQAGIQSNGTLKLF